MLPQTARSCSIANIDKRASSGQVRRSSGRPLHAPGKTRTKTPTRISKIREVLSWLQDWLLVSTGGELHVLSLHFSNTVSCVGATASARARVSARLSPCTAILQAAQTFLWPRPVSALTEEPLTTRRHEPVRTLLHCCECMASRWHHLTFHSHMPRPEVSIAGS